MFDYSYHMKKLLADISRRCPTFHHIDTDRLLVAIAPTRNRKRQGLQAKVVPLTFRGGSRLKSVSDTEYYEMPKIVQHGREILYLIYFFLPRFQNLEFQEKLMIIFHELYHISPAFDGDIRRFPGRFYQHSKSEREYDRIVNHLATSYLKLPGSEEPTRFLRLNYNRLLRKYDDIDGYRITMPEPVRVICDYTVKTG